MTDPESDPDLGESSSELMARITALEASQNALIERLTQLEGRQGATPVPNAAVSQPPPPSPPHPDPRPTPPTPTPAPAHAPAPAPAPAPTRPTASIENVLRLVGAALIALAALFLVSTAISRGYITPEIQLLAATALGAGCLAAGLWLKDEEPWGSTLAIAGTTIVATCAGAGHGWLELYGPTVGIILTSLAALSGAAVAVRLANQWIATTASLTLLVVPTLAGILAEAPVGLASAWLAAFIVAVTGFGLWQRWGYYRLISTWTIAAWLMGLLFVESVSGSQNVIAGALSALVAAVLWSNPMLSRLRPESSGSWPLVLAWHNASAAAVPLWAWLTMSTFFTDDTGVYALAMGAGFAGISVLAWRFTALVSSKLLALQLVGALILTAFGALVFFDGSPVPVVFLGLAIASFVAAQPLDRDTPLRVSAAILAAIASLGFIAELVDLALSDNLSAGRDALGSVLAGLAIASVGAWFVRRWEHTKAAELAYGYVAIAGSGLGYALTLVLTPDRFLASVFLLVTVGLALVLVTTSTVFGKAVMALGMVAGLAALLGAFGLMINSIVNANIAPNDQRLAVLVTLLTASVATWRLWNNQEWRHPAFLATWVLGYGWVLSVFLPVTQGQFGVSIVWAAAAVGAIWLGVRQRDRVIRTVGLLSLGLVITKLLTVDLAEVDTLWRVILFLVIGLGLLRLAYVLPKLESRAETPSGSLPSNDLALRKPGER